MLNGLFLSSVLAFLTAAPLSAQNIEARFAMEKTLYLAGEPLFVVLTMRNKGNKSVWLDFKSPDVPSLCQDFAVEMPGAESADQLWGCGIAGSCARGLREIPPGESISLRQLLNRQFRLQRLGTYAVRAHTTVAVHNQNLFDSTQVDQFDVSDTLAVEVQRGSEDQLRAAFQRLVGELDSHDPMKRGEAAGAITELAPPILQDVLIELTRTNYAFPAIAALRKADTLKTRNELARIATGGGDSMLRIEAIRNLGRTGDVNYLPTLSRLIESADKQIQNAAAEALGNLGGVGAVQQLATLATSPDANTRMAGANGLGVTHARQAVPILIRLLLDSDRNVQNTAVSGLTLLTHHIALDGNRWADMTTPQSAAAVHQRWLSWWTSRADVSKIYGMADCASPQPFD